MELNRNISNRTVFPLRGSCCLTKTMEGAAIYFIPVLILTADSVLDVSKREIYLFLIIAGIFSGLFWQAFLQNTTPVWIAVCFLPGIMFFLAADLSGGQIGRGDAISLALAGIWSSAFDIWGIVFTAAFISGIGAGFLWLRKQKNARIPFVPFLTAGYSFYLIWR